MKNPHNLLYEYLTRNWLCRVFVNQKLREDSLFLFWYLLVGALQGTSRVEERKGGPNPFWETLCGSRLESGVERKRRGGACL